MKYIVLLFLTILFGCSNTKEIAEEKIPTGPVSMEEVDRPAVLPIVKESRGKANSISGIVMNRKKEPIDFAKISLILNGNVVLGGFSDEKGVFHIQSIPEGVYDLEVNLLGYEPQMVCCLKIGKHKKVTFELSESLNIDKIRVLKPIIYLYPEIETEIQVKVKYDGKLTHTYPVYPKNGWKVVAQPDGIVKDQDGKEYYALFWEGIPTNPIAPKDGFVVPKKDLIPFLELSLARLGLNRREANEFILFWLPMMGDNDFNLIHFSNEEYTSAAELEIIPIPETLIRVMMIVKPLKQPIDFPLQDLKPLEKQRKGYTVVEWGGSVIHDRAH